MLCGLGGELFMQQRQAKYRIRNWNNYNKSLIQRGSMTVWFSEEAIKKWSASEGVKKKGRPKIYSDDAILTALIIRSVFHLPLRALLVQFRLFLRIEKLYSEKMILQW